MRDALFAERIDAFYAQAPGSTVVNATLAMVAAGVMWRSTAPAVLWIWLAGVAASLVLRLAMYRGWRGDPRRRENAARWAAGCTLAMLASGVAWGFGGVAMFQPDRPLLEAFWMILLCGIAAGVVAANAFHLPALVAYLVPLLVPVSVRAAMEGTGEQWAIAAGMALYLVFMLQQGRHQSRLIGDAISQRLQNVELVARLREERESADAARERAEAAGEAKARFFAAASHDLRQPLHALSLYAGALAEDAAGAARDKAGRILQGVDALATLFDHILDSARMESGALHPEVRAIAVQDILDAMSADHAEVARAMGLRLRVRPSAAWVATDPALLRRALGNLVANAVRYTDAGTILVAARRRGDRVSIEVRDSGRGIAPEHHAKVFEDFFQVDNPGRDRTRGSGLGLATVKRIGAALDAPLALRSAPGAGSTFSIALPLAEPGDALPIAAPEAGATTDPLEGRVVLVVDDDRMAREALVAMLERWGIRVLACASAEEIPALAPSPAPEAVVTDWRLGARTGADAIASARARWGLLPALIVTGEQDAREATAVAPVLRKPARPVQLRSTLQHALRSPGASTPP